MQVLVSSNNKRKTAKTRIKSVISTILIILFAICSSAFLIVLKKKNLIYEERVIYVISVASSKKEKDLNSSSELLKNLGGANVIYKFQDEYHLIANVYLDFQSAEEVKNEINTYFLNAQILKLKIKKVSRKTKNQIKNNYELERVVRYLYSLINEFQELQFGFLSGSLTQGKFFSEMVQVRLKISDFIKNNKVDNEISGIIYSHLDIILYKLTNFLTGFELSGSKQNYICNYFVGFYLNYIELFNSL